jgi:disulfide bond formation protein DsbB
MQLIAIKIGLGATTGTALSLTSGDILIGIGVILVILLLVLGLGALLAVLVKAVDAFLSHNVPPNAVMAAFNASYAAQLEKTRNKMVNEKSPTGGTDVEDDEDDELTGSSGTFDVLARGSRYVALLAAWIATCGSLFFSEVLGWIPCVLCWYQRIFMYPLALILAVGILRKDKGLYKYALVLSIPGACISLLHYLDQKTTLLRGMINCVVGVPCSADYLNWFGGVVTIPFLALIAFLIITFCMVATRLGETEEEASDTATATAPPSNRLKEALPVFGIIAAVVIAFVLAGISVKNNIAFAAGGGATVTVTVAPLPTVDAAALAHGKILYESSCAICHGTNGEGTAAGRPLTNSELVKTSSTADLVKFVRVGRGINDPHNTSGQPMPASGGQPNYTDADIAAVIGYIRQLAGVNPSGK